MSNRFDHAKTSPKDVETFGAVPWPRGNFGSIARSLPAKAVWSTKEGLGHLRPGASAAINLSRLGNGRPNCPGV